MRRVVGARPSRIALELTRRTIALSIAVRRGEAHWDRLAGADPAKQARRLGAELLAIATELEDKAHGLGVLRGRR